MVTYTCNASGQRSVAEGTTDLRRRVANYFRNRPIGPYDFTGGCTGGTWIYRSLRMPLPLRHVVLSTEVARVCYEGGVGRVTGGVPVHAGITTRDAMTELIGPVAVSELPVVNTCHANNSFLKREISLERGPRCTRRSTEQRKKGKCLKPRVHSVLSELNTTVPPKDP